MPSAEELERIRADLEAIVERLDDVAFGELREASAAGARERPEIEKRVTRARNAVLRAIGLLTSPGDEPGDD